MGIYYFVFIVSDTVIMGIVKAAIGVDEDPDDTAVIQPSTILPSGPPAASNPTPPPTNHPF